MVWQNGLAEPANVQFETTRCGDSLGATQYDVANQEGHFESRSDSADLQRHPGTHEAKSGHREANLLQERDG